MSHTPISVMLLTEMLKKQDTRQHGDDDLQRIINEAKQNKNKEEITTMHANMQEKLSLEIMHHNVDVVNDKVNQLQKQIDNLFVFVMNIQDKLDSNRKVNVTDEKVKSLEMILDVIQHNLDDINTIMLAEREMKKSNDDKDNSSVNFQKKLAVFDTILSTINYNNCDVEFSIDEINIQVKTDARDVLVINIL